MLKKRIVPAILLSKGRVLTSQNFKPWRTVGSLAQSIRLQVQREADELIICCIDNDLNTFSKREMFIINSNANIPITLFGQIDSLDKARYLLNHGADRIGICSQLYKQDFTLLESLILSLGRQSVVVDIPYTYDSENSEFLVWDWKLGQKLFPLEPYLALIASARPGEIILSSVDRDGTMKGMCSEVASIIPPGLPFVLRCGAGSSTDLLSGLQSKNISAVSASSIFSFTDVTPATMHHYLVEQGIPARNTASFPFGLNGNH